MFRLVVSACLLILLCVSSATTVSGLSSAPITPSAPYAKCNQSAEAQQTAQSQNMNIANGIAVAESSREFSQLTQGYNVAFRTEDNLWKWSLDCNVTLQSTHFEFSLRNSAGVVTILVVNENPAMTAVENMTLTTISQGGSNSGSSVTPLTSYSNSYWSGYELWGKNSGGTQVPVYQVTSEWNETSVSPPASPTNACLNQFCDVAVMNGLANNAGGSNGVVEAGSDSIVSCTSSNSCTYTYYLWYGTDTGSTTSSSTTYWCMNVAAGDYVGVNIMSEYIQPGGGPVTTYTIYGADDTTGYSCGSVGDVTDTSMGTPYYGEFMTLRFYYNGVPAYYGALAKFGTIHNYDANMYYGGSNINLYTPYTNGWYNQYTMNNGCGNNIALQAMQKQDTLHADFNQHYNTSCGT